MISKGSIVILNAISFIGDGLREALASKTRWYRENFALLSVYIGKRAFYLALLNFLFE